jgi:CRP-like cAMP-binding protein
VVSRRTDPVASVLVVLAGGLGIVQSDGEVRVATGEVLGVLSLLQGTPGIADVRATEDGTRILCITRQSLDELSEAEPRLALQLTVNLARILCGKLVNVHARAFAARPPESPGI